MNIKILSCNDFLESQKQSIQVQSVSQQFLGVEEIDRHINRTPEGRLVVIGGRPMQGKAYILDSILSNVTKSSPALLCSKQKSSPTMANRLMRLVRESPESASNIFTLCSSDLTSDLLIDNIKTAVAEKGIKYVLIDEIRYSFTDYSWTEWGLPNRILYKLRQLAIDFNVTVICTYITSWEADDRAGDKYPIMVDFEGAADFADIVLGVYRPESYEVLVDEFGNSQRGIIYINILKSPLLGLHTIQQRMNHIV